MLQILSLCEERTVIAFSPRISAWTVARQLDHLSRVGHDISARLARAIEDGDFGDRETGKSMMFTGRVLLGIGWLPRGVAQAPRSVIPDENPKAAALEESFVRLRAGYAALSSREDSIAPSRARMKHPYFGGLKPATWVRFLGVHQHHHLKIVRDILRSGRGAAPTTSRESKSSVRDPEA